MHFETHFLCFCNDHRLKGETKKEKREDSEKWHRVERSWGNFQRSFRLPENANTEAISADYVNGVLKVDVPKKAIAQAPSSRPIPITGGQ